MVEGLRYRRGWSPLALYAISVRGLGTRPRYMPVLAAECDLDCAGALEGAAERAADADDREGQDFIKGADGNHITNENSSWSFSLSRKKPLSCGPSDTSLLFSELIVVKGFNGYLDTVSKFL